MRNWTRMSWIALAALAAFAAGCSDDGDGGTGLADEDSPFADYETWEQVEHSIAMSDLLGPGAHQGGDGNAYTRRIYTAELPARGVHAEGSAYVKETYTFDENGDKEFAAAGGLLGMIKRAPGYHDNGADWEYFILDPGTREVLDSGHGESGIGACMGCHAQANQGHGDDYIFAHPAPYVAAADSFAGYLDWPVIGEETGPDPFLGNAHGASVEGALRTIYKRQLAARPEDELGYPTGTMLLKEVTAGSEVIGRTAMVKRGAGFDPGRGDWEYFMWDLDSDELMRGDGDAMGMCFSCHAAANGGAGKDYIFAHDGDPFNN